MSKVVPCRLVLAAAVAVVAAGQGAVENGRAA
jgi:hypothetical protein